ncbi:hypothetical protein LguiA_011618 [Lonicera macranthoides]
MGQQQSSREREESLYKEVVQGNVRAIESLRAKGAGLEWVNEEGKTPLIVACMSSDLFIVAKTLIDLGANVNSYRAGCDGGTPLHHAAKRGLRQTVRLLLSKGANPLVRNDDGQTPLDVARIEGFVDVVRLVERFISFFSGWLREFCGPGFLEVYAPQLLSRKIWIVIIPSGFHHPTKALKLELVIYSTLLDSKPRTIIDLWNADFRKPNLHQSDPALIIFDKSTMNEQRWKEQRNPTSFSSSALLLHHSYSFLSSQDNMSSAVKYVDLTNYLEAKMGISRSQQHRSKRETFSEQITVLPPMVLQSTQTSTPPTATQTSREVQLAMTISASIQSSMETKPLVHANNANGWEGPADGSAHNGRGLFGGPRRSESSITRSVDDPPVEEYSGWGVPESTRPSNHSSQSLLGEYNGWGPRESISSFSSQPDRDEYNRWGMPESRRSSNNSSQLANEEYNEWGMPASRRPNNSTQPVVRTSNELPLMVSTVPSAPPVPQEDSNEDLGNYAWVDYGAPRRNEANNESTCVICWDAPAEGACIPCGHMAVCMSCLNVIKSKQGSCPVCRAEIDQVVKIYAL